MTIVLQWGRSDGAAEGPWPKNEEPQATGFNGAAAMELRKAMRAAIVSTSSLCWTGAYRGVRHCAVTGGLETERPRQVVPRSA